MYKCTYEVKIVINYKKSFGKFLSLISQDYTDFSCLMSDETLITFEILRKFSTAGY